MTRILKVPRSNLGPQTGYLDCNVFVSFLISSKQITDSISNVVTPTSFHNLIYPLFTNNPCCCCCAAAAAAVLLLLMMMMICLPKFFFPRGWYYQPMHLGIRVSFTVSANTFIRRL